MVRHEVVFLPSILTLEQLRERPRAPASGPPRIAVLADPVFEADDPRVTPGGPPSGAGAPATPHRDLARALRDVGPGPAGSALPRLPYSRDEADAIVAAAAPRPVLRLLDFDASRSTALSARLDGYDIVHFATHGVLDDARPEASGLVLSLVDRAGRPQDGFVGVRDLYGLKRAVELVVLSGCRTGLGQEIRGEGLLGVVRAFLHAGARRVVASLWEVDDRATAVFMKAFYEAMLASRHAPAAALREAQLALRGWPRWRDPFYWAAFVVQGEWN
jgi:CHAT domain-containing protein